MMPVTGSCCTVATIPVHTAKTAPGTQPVSCSGGISFAGGLSGRQAGQMMPVTVSTAVPGVTVHAPVVGSCCAVAAGTVITPGTVENAPVTSL